MYGFFICIDEFAGFILQYIPFYYFLKVCVLIWLFNPATKGSLKVYHGVIRPLLHKYGVHLDNASKLIKETFNDSPKKTENKIVVTPPATETPTEELKDD